jgi:hypothetical protein
MRRISMKIIFILLFIPSILYCNSIKQIYFTSANHTHLIAKSNEFQFAVYRGNGWDFRIAYSPFEHIAVYGAKSNNADTPLDYSCWDLAIGTYFKWSISRFEILAGLGKGTASRRNGGQINFKNVSSDGKYLRSFFQTNIGTSYSFFEGGFALRLTYVDYSEFNIFINSETARHKNVFEVYFEPSCFVRASYKQLNLELQIEYLEDFEFHLLNYQKLSKVAFSVGLILKFGEN